MFYTDRGVFLCIGSSQKAELESVGKHVFKLCVRQVYHPLSRLLVVVVFFPYSHDLISAVDIFCDSSHERSIHELCKPPKLSLLYGLAVVGVFPASRGVSSSSNMFLFYRPLSFSGPSSLRQMKRSAHPGLRLTPKTGVRRVR